MSSRRLFLLGVPGVAGCARDRRPRLNVLNWSEYVADDTMTNFERACGVRVRYGVYESNEEMLARVMSGNSGWDVVFPSHYFLAPMREMGLLAELDVRRLPGLDALEARYRRPPWDPELRWGVPYMTGACGILYRREAGAPTHWADLWTAHYRGRVTMLDDPPEVFGACLKKLGLPLNTPEPDHLRRAQREALQQKPLVRAYLNAEVRDQIVAGDVLAAQLWATTAQQAVAASGALGFCYPAEGFSLYCDTVAVLAESGRRELAHRFIDYLLRPGVAAAIAAQRLTATANARARALLPEVMRSNRVLYPDEATLARGEWFAPLPAAAQRLRDRLWTELKSA